MAIEKTVIGISFRGFKCVGLWVLVSEWVWSWSMFPKCDWSYCQIPMVKIRQHFALFLWWKSDSASPHMHHSTPNTILTKILTWECGNGDAPFSRQKFGRVLRLVHNDALARFRVCILMWMQNVILIHVAYWCECKMSYFSPLMFSLLYLFGA